MRTLLTLLFLCTPLYASDITKAKAIAIAEATVACQEQEVAKVTPAPEKPKVVVPKEKFIIVRSSNCVYCDKLEAEVIPDLKKKYQVEIENGGHGVSSFPTIIFMVGDKEQWRTTGFTSLETLEKLATGVH